MGCTVMSDFCKVNNMRELQKEKGLYYPYIMQILGAPIINGEIICETDMKYLYSQYIAGVFEILAGIYVHNKDDKNDHSNKVFPKISKKEFKHSILYAISDLFYGGCEPENLDEDKVFAFFDKEESIPEDPKNPFSKRITIKKYRNLIP